MSTSNRNEKIYSVAKKSTMVEAILTCNWLLGFEFYGMSQKKRGFVTFGIGYRIFCVLSHVSLLYAIFGLRFYEGTPLEGYDLFYTTCRTLRGPDEHAVSFIKFEDWEGQK